MFAEGTQIERMRKLLDLPLHAITNSMPTVSPSSSIVAAWDVPDLARSVLITFGLPGTGAFEPDPEPSIDPELECAGRQFYRLGQWGGLWIIGVEAGTSEVVCINRNRPDRVDAVCNSSLSTFVIAVWRWSRIDEVLDPWDETMYDALDLFVQEQRALDRVAGAAACFAWDAVIESY